jgi:lia operon protein LiaG
MQKKYIVDEKFNNLKRFFLISYVLGMMILLILLLLSIHWYIPFKIGFAITLVVLLFVIPIMYGLVCLFEKNNILLKIFTFCLVGIISLGLIVSLFNSIYLETTEVMECYYFDNNYSDIEIQGSDFDIKIYLSITEENKVECIENKKINFDVQIINNKLIIKQIDNRNFFDSLFNFSNLEIQLHLSNETINKLFIDNNTGDITIGEFLVFNDIEINSSTSDVYIESKDVNNIDVKLSTGSTIIKNCFVNKNIIVESSTGNIELENVNCEKLDITVSTGDVILTNVLVANDFNMNGSTSDLTFTDFDASNIYITVSTGDVNGTILTSKIFMPNSSAGDVDVPETTTGGICKIETSTGNIRIKIK